MCLVTSSKLARLAGYTALLSLSAGFSYVGNAAARQAAPSSSAQSAVRPVGTIRAISGNTITLTTDAGSEVIIVVQDATKLVRVAPGQTNLKDATAVTLADLQAGDRILVRGIPAPDGKSVLASSVIAMKKADIADRQAREREEWQKHGVGGVVSSVSATGNAIVVSLPAIGEKKTVTVHVSNTTILRRYSPDSIKFDDARLAPVSEIKTGDQLRARGARSADGSELTAEEIVSGTFRNISGLIVAVDPSNSTIVVQDLATKKAIAIKVTTDSQLRKLPPPMAQRIAARLKGIPAEAVSSSTPSAAGSSNAGQPVTQSASASASPGSGAGQGMGGSGGSGRPAGAPAADLQQAINRIPAAKLADFQKDDAVMIVATEGGPNSAPTAITLLGGVETILEAPNASTILSAWSLGGTPGGEATAQ